MGTIRLNEAVAFANKTRPLKKKELAKILWPGSAEHSAAANFSNLASGKTRQYNYGMIETICRVCGVTADFLFGLEDEPTRIAELESKKKRLEDARALISDLIDDMKDSI